MDILIPESWTTSQELFQKIRLLFKEKGYNINKIGPNKTKNIKTNYICCTEDKNKKWVLMYSDENLSISKMVLYSEKEYKTKYF